MIYQFKCVNPACDGEMFEVKQEMNREHFADCPKCHYPAQRVYTSPMHYWPDVLFDRHGKKQSPDDLPSVPSGTRWTHGWRPDKEKDNE